MKEKEILKVVNDLMFEIRKEIYTGKTPLSSKFLNISVGDLVCLPGSGAISDSKDKDHHIGFLLSVEYIGQKNIYGCDKNYKIITLKDKKIVNWRNSSFYRFPNSHIKDFPLFSNKIESSK